MKGKKIVLLVLLCGVFEAGYAARADQNAPELAEWTIFIAMEAANNLSPFAISNLNDMARIGSIPGKVNICVEWNQFNKNGTWRYRVGKGRIELVEHFEHGHSGNCVKDMVDGATWAFTKYPSKHRALFFWDHGVGSLDPVWGNMRGSLIDGTCMHTGNCRHKANAYHDRGILFDEKNKIYMTNQQMVDALHKIVHGPLNGQKLDVVGMDACLMAMMEVAYQISPFGNFFVASQEVEQAEGWPYSSFLGPLVTGTLSPLDFAQTMIHCYGLHYKNKKPPYTQSLINLATVRDLKDNIDHMVQQLGLCVRHYGASIKALVQEARRACLHFSTPSYIDLHSFYQELHSRLTHASRHGNVRVGHIATLREILTHGMNLIQSSVLANVVSPNFANAKGISIYYPRYRIDKSYFNCDFARNSLWLDFLQEHG